MIPVIGSKPGEKCKIAIDLLPTTIFQIASDSWLNFPAGFSTSSILQTLPHALRNRFSVSTIQKRGINVKKSTDDY
jgi:hypothetical protein